MEEDGQLVKFLFNEEREVIAEETGNDVIRYVRGLGIISSDSESARTYYHYVSDNQGSVRLILTDTENDRRIRNYYCYDAFGESVISHEDVHNRFRFNGEQYDSVTSQYYLRARFYNPVIGRFTQEDTYYGDGLNLYEYCRNNPVLYRDPSGHDAVNQGNLYGKEIFLPDEYYQKLNEYIAKALVARDKEVARIQSLSISQQRKVATVVAGVDLRTGEVYVGVKRSSNYGRLAVCAEDIVFRGLGGNINANIIMTPAVRPRTGELIPVCPRCQTKYPPNQFMKGTTFDE